MSAVIGITLMVWMSGAVLFSLGICSAAARPVPKPARTNGPRQITRQRRETTTGESPHLNCIGRRRLVASSFARRHLRQLVFGPAGERFSQRGRVPADETVKTHAAFRNHSSSV